MSEEIVRIKKVEHFNGTYYIPQVRKWKTHWFSASGYEWVSFKLMRFGDFRYFNNIDITDSPWGFGDDFLWEKGFRLAEWYCEEYMRIHHGSEVVKVWSVMGE